MTEDGRTKAFARLVDEAQACRACPRMEASDELGFAWDDPGAAIPWPTQSPILSDRDAANPPLAGVITEP